MTADNNGALLTAVFESSLRWIGPREGGWRKEYGKIGISRDHHPIRGTAGGCRRLWNTEHRQRKRRAGLWERAGKAVRRSLIGAPRRADAVDQGQPCVWWQ